MLLLLPSIPVQLKPATHEMPALGSVPWVWHARVAEAYWVAQLTAGRRSQQTLMQLVPSQVAPGERLALRVNSPEQVNAEHAKAHVSGLVGAKRLPLVHVYVALVALAFAGRYWAAH